VPAALADDSLIGFVLADKYRVVRQIGRGGMGIVYEGEHIGLGKRVAIKLMLEKYADDFEALARFQREALAASRIGSAHIIDVSDIGTAPDGRAFVVMELLEGAPLSRVLEASGPMAPTRAIHIMRQVLRAVGAAHDKSIVHRDLKPDNIFLVDKDGQRDFVKLLDFGISKVIDPDLEVAATKLTTTGVVIGTPLYMAPEQALGSEVDHRADIYACGVILYEMLAGRPPFDGATYAVLVGKLLTQDPDHLASVRSGLPAALVAAVHRALDKEPTRRFASAELFSASLPGERTPSMIELAGTLASGIALPASKPVKPMPSKSRPWLAVGAAMLVGIATATVMIMKQQGNAPASAPPAAATPAPSAAKVEASSPSPSPAAAPSTGLLDVKTNPPGASVTIDGGRIGTAPISVTLRPGPHHLRIELAGHTSIEEDEEVRAGERASVVVALPEAPRDTTVARPPVPKPHVDHPSNKPLGLGAASAQPPTPPPPPKHEDPPPIPTKVPQGPGTKPNPY
jgi:serine/threonine-protein kinase